ncbi:MAG: U32 family peptidase [Proteobacteria bacterium]|nr:U32 family peptidase [Desulfobacteraceae bacterium]MBU3980858.1 U32 family peptidase [Pseudomonadota bacterium]MBU4011873.1 U32 family peptidase [Pseudomonadota bacterium]MBU4067071.1 U32 family peptidase [Pseudomonadota bacterium]MBU4100838.1 U32 family peptidase [Pseudomonadota bacterium]
MSKRNRKIELLAPAGNFEKLEIAIHYGADAVYLAGKEFSLRNFSGNFTLDELHKAVKFARNCSVKTYVACNIYSRNPEQKAIKDYLKALSEISPDAVIIADPGILMEASKIIPQIPLHLSTQANTTNYKTVMFWEKFGIKRINVARELSLKEIKEIVSRSSIEIEAFVHGSMCISYSGRCLLSAFMTNRSSNLGECSHPCRWNYAVMEEKRPGQYYPIAENKNGTYIFNSRDLCMIEHIPEIIESGLSSIKIEGRMKGINYVASAVKVYREAIDSYYENPDGFKIQKYWIDELNNISHRGYCTGFYFGDPEQISPNFEYNLNSGLLFVGKIIETSGPQNVNIDVRNKVFKGDAVEVLTIKGPSRKDEIIQIIDQNGESVSFAQPGSRVTIFLNSDYLPNDLIRRACDDSKNE